MTKLKLPEIDAKRFYQVGKFSFYTVGLIGLIRIVDLWSELKSYDIFSSLSSVVFNLILASFFAYLQGKEDVKEVSDSDIFKMNKALDDLELKGGIENAKKI